jgi:thioredoxin-like negative regulator of GroEL
VGGQARVFTLNVDEELEAAERFDVRAVPATLLFLNGQERGRLTGFHDQAALLALVKSGQTDNEE